MKMKKFNAIFDGLINTLFYIAGVLIMCQMLVELYEVIARYFLNRPTIWGMEFCEYTLFLMGFLGTTWVLKRGAHIKVTIVLERLKPRTQTYFNLFASFIGIMISLIIFWFSLKTSWENYVTGVRVVKTYSLHKWFFLSFIALGYLLMLIEFVRQFSGHLRKLGLKEEEGQTP
jgi:TRAP-type C4-dicarboxylate transport system permease small subunit